MQLEDTQIYMQIDLEKLEDMIYNCFRHIIYNWTLNKQGLTFFLRENQVWLIAISKKIWFQLALSTKVLQNIKARRENKKITKSL